MPVSSVPASSVTSLIMDDRSDAGHLYIGAFTAADQVHGVYSGFMSNPDGSRNPFYGAASFESDDGRVAGSFLFYAYYVSTCSGRACGGTLGWHYHNLGGEHCCGQISLPSLGPLGLSLCCSERCT
jgi:hypothetical protein